MTQHTASPKRRCPRWVIPAALAAVFAVGVGAVVVTNTATNSAGDPAPQTAGQVASGDPTPTPSAQDTSTWPNGCLAGPDITASDLADIRDEKKFTPLGAVEFLGAFMQFTGAASPERREGWNTTVVAMTSGEPRSVLLAQGDDTSFYGDTQTYSIDLSRSGYLIQSVSDTEVVVDFAGLTLQNGQPQPVPGSEEDYLFSGSRFTLTAGPYGWDISGLESDVPWIDAATQHGYGEGC